SISRAIAEKARTIRLPIHMHDNLIKMIRTARELSYSLGHEPTVDEVAGRMELPLETVRLLWRIVREPLSLETPIGAEGDSTLADVVADRGSVSPVEQATSASVANQTRQILRKLSPREEKILLMRFGFDGVDAQTLEEVAKVFGVSRERIRQIEAKAI